MRVVLALMTASLAVPVSAQDHRFNLRTGMEIANAAESDAASELLCRHYRRANAAAAVRACLLAELEYRYQVEAAGLSIATDLVPDDLRDKIVICYREGYPLVRYDGWGNIQRCMQAAGWYRERKR
jgi:hypothetical protein